MKRFFKCPWAVSICTVLLGFMLTVVLDVVGGKAILSTITDVIKFVYTSIITILNFKIKVWWLLIGVTILILILWILANMNDTKSTEEPKWLKYTEDVIDGFHWKWEWKNQYDRTFAIENLHPVCLSCGTPYVTTYDYHHSLLCPRCKNKTNTQIPNIDHIKIIINDNADKMIAEEKKDKEK